jgi:molybdate transport system substrate-binding protein
MTTARRALRAGLKIAGASVLMAGVLFVSPVQAAQITVLSGSAIEPGLTPAASAFEKQTGHKVTITFATTPERRKRIAAGEVFDVVIVPPDVVEEFARAGKIDAERVYVGRAGLGVAVRSGAPVPDISSAEAIRRAVLDAESVVFNRASTGLYFEGVLKKMGVYGEIEGRITRHGDGAAVMEHLVKGKGKEIGFGAITEILVYKDKGLRLVGPLPADIQNYTSYYAVPMSAGTQKETAGAFARFLAGPGKAQFSAAGID